MKNNKNNSQEKISNKEIKHSATGQFSINEKEKKSIKTNKVIRVTSTNIGKDK